MYVTVGQILIMIDYISDLPQYYKLCMLGVVQKHLETWKNVRAIGSKSHTNRCSISPEKVCTMFLNFTVKKRCPLLMNLMTKNGAPGLLRNLIAANKIK